MSIKKAQIKRRKPIENIKQEKKSRYKNIRIEKIYLKQTYSFLKTGCGKWIILKSLKVANHKITTLKP